MRGEKCQKSTIIIRDKAAIAAAAGIVELGRGSSLLIFAALMIYCCISIMNVL